MYFLFCSTPHPTLSRGGTMNWSVKIWAEKRLTPLLTSPLERNDVWDYCYPFGVEFVWHYKISPLLRRGMMFGNIWGFELYGSYPKMEQISPLQGRGVGERVIQNWAYELMNKIKYETSWICLEFFAPLRMTGSS